MADYWKSQGRKRCDYCNCWIADNKPSIDFHEGGRRHKENVSRKLKDIYRKSAKEAKAQRKYNDDMRKMEEAANQAYLKDVQHGNMKDLTLDHIVKQKANRSEFSQQSGPSNDHPNPNAMPYADPSTVPRGAPPPEESDKVKIFRPDDEIDPFDPNYQQKLAKQRRKKLKAEKKAAALAKKQQEEEEEKQKEEEQEVVIAASQPVIPVEKYWYEARGPKGSSYYWHIYTNQSVWEPPYEGFVSLAEQAQQAEEQQIQEQFLNQIDSENSKSKAEILEEQRANAEREKLKEIRRKHLESKKAEKQEDSEGVVKTEGQDEEEEGKIPYRRDYSIPEKPQPYGSWQVVKETKQIDLQLPKAKPVPEPLFEFDPEEEPDEKFEFTEKVCARIVSDSDDEESSTMFKKRFKFGNSKRRNQRQRVNDD